MLKKFIIKINKNKVNIYLFIYMIGTIIFSRNTMISSVILGFKTSFFISIVLLIPIIIIFFKKVKENELDVRNSIIIIFFIIIILLSIVLKKDWQMYNASIIYYIISGVLLASLIKFKYFKKWYINIFFILSIYSIFTTYIAKTILIQFNIQEQLENIGIIVTNSSGYKFLNLGLGFALFQKDYIRNYGIFTEPSIYQFYLTIATVMILFFKDKRDRKDWIKLFIFIITMISTFSAATMVILACLFMLYIIKLLYNNRKNIKYVIIISSICVLSIIMLFSIKSTRNFISTTYKKITTINESSVSRYGSICFTIEKTIKSPIVGNRIAEITTYEGNITNTTFAISAIYGIITWSYSLYFTYKLASNNNKNNKIFSIAIMVIIMLSYNSHFYLGVQSFWLILLSPSNLFKEGEIKYEDTLDS